MTHDWLTDTVGACVAKFGTDGNSDESKFIRLNITLMLYQMNPNCFLSFSSTEDCNAKYVVNKKRQN